MRDLSSDHPERDGGALAPDLDVLRTCIAVVDASRARLFAYERSAAVGGVEERMTEERDLVNPARRLRPEALFSETRPGSSRTGHLQYTLDDHRDAHLDAMDVEFSRFVIEELTSVLREAHAQRLILCASPRMLGKLRHAGRDLAKEGVVIDELARDLVKLTPTELRDHLASRGLMPARSRRPPPT